MSSSELLKTRFLYPGLFLIWIFYFIFKGAYLNENPLNNYEYYVVCLSISTVYAVLPLRKLILDPINIRIFDRNITNSMIEIFTGVYTLSEEKPTAKIIGLLRNKPNAVTEQKSKIVSERKCMDCFYRIIDNDPSLQHRSDAARINTCIVSCLVDNILLSILVLLYVVVSSFFIDSKVNLDKVLPIIILVFSISLVLLPFAIRGQFVLSERQLRYIYRHRTDIDKKPDVGECEKCSQTQFVK